jgi:hypothetical protein
MTDTPITPDLLEQVSKNDNVMIFGKMRREMLVEGELFDITEVAKSKNINRPSAITQRLFRELYPWSEDGVKNITFEERVEDMLNEWRKATAADPDKAFLHFSMIFQTYCKEIKTDGRKEDNNVVVEVFSDGKPREKKLELFCACHPGDWQEPVLTFMFNEARWLRK